MIAPDFLKAIADRHGITEAELEALSLAINNETDSTAGIAEELGISSDAVRKRLGEVYQKFGITGSGRGKLLSLQQMLKEQYAKHLSRRRIFIAWSGENGKHLAEGLKETIFKHPKLEPWLSSWDIASEKTRLIGDADFGVVCLTHGFSSWANFNIGVLLGRLRNVQILRLSEPLTGPLENIKQVNSTSKEDLKQLLIELLSGDVKEAEKWIESIYPAWEKFITQDAINSVEEEKHQEDKATFNKLISSVKQTLDGLKESDNIHKNRCFQQIIIESLRIISQEFRNVRTSHLIPASFYPRYLFLLQKNLNVCVKALAVVGQEEHFWQEEFGRKIGQSTQSKSLRVFVFTRPEDFERNFEVLMEHSMTYEVRSMSYDKLANEFPGFCKDFSIIEKMGNKVLAEYIGRGTVKDTRFSIDDSVFIHEKKLNEISGRAVLIPKLNELNGSQIIDKMNEIQALIFGHSLTCTPMKPIEMSDYIDVENYDNHEEKHAYFQAMMTRMISIFNNHRIKNTKRCRLLELGAGTGIFTKRLASLPNVHIIAVELDWVCIKKLQHNLSKSKYRFLEVVNEDSCTYSHSNRFDYVLSSFADHHIKVKDKSLYFKNIRRNLEPDGLFVVGDEFLPPHDAENREDRHQALEKYHRHIIQIAENEGEMILADLELDALRSGLEEIGDFKVSCEHYESLLSEAGFQFEKEKIGPKDRDDVGGVYVYTAWPTS